MKLLDYVKIIYHSFFSRKLYKYIFSSWQGNIFIYLLISLLLIATPTAFSFLNDQFKIDIKQINGEQEANKFNLNIKHILEQAPEMKLHNSILSFSDLGEKIVVIKNLEQLPIIKIDLSDNIDNSIVCPINIYKDHVDFRLKPDQINSMQFASIFDSMDIIVDKALWLDLLEQAYSYRYLSLLVVIVMIFAVFIFYSIFHAIAYTAAVILLRYRSNAKGMWPPIFRVMIVAGTPPLILKSLEAIAFNSFVVNESLAILFSMIISVSSVLYAIYASNQMQKY